MAPIPGKTLEFAFPDAAEDGHPFARESESKKPVPFGAKLGPLNLARQFETANDDRLFAGSWRWGKRPREPLCVATLSEMPISVASEKPIFGREADQPLHETIGLITRQIRTLELAGDQNAREI